ncbi:hypothetical protein SIID45300_00968 [Candidatus Magnetaquicoccaceae bacterium FCR-1]|uniref:Uncharacterized protein n=1 Tax=Candidatus Magnetaquiglobus chichijimensis TaxID=3141448 RepID=A0ABQ0C7J2_9PROT
MLPANGFGRSDVCPSCSKDARVCLNCRFHDPGSYNECRETVAERVVDKEKNNFCEDFMPKGALPRNESGRSSSGRGANGGGSSHDNSRNRTQSNTTTTRGQANNSAAWAAAEALFKKG